MQAVSGRSLAVCLAALVIVLTSVVAASAQGLYYKEIRKDDRIYVFNDAAEASRFEKSGELGRAITRPGAGPKGETVIADSERALELFFFKYNISEPVPQPAQPTQRIEWRDGKTRITTDLAYLEISNRIQVRYTHDLPDDSVTLPGTNDPGDAKGSFRIRRAKLKFEGTIWKPELSYEVQMNWPGAVGSNVGAFLEDAVLDWDVSKKNTFRVRFGQFKVPFGRQELTSSGNQSFVDRSLVSNQFARGRDTGVAVWGTTPNNKLEYRVGVFNGNGLTRPENDNASFQVNGRLMWQPNGSQSLKQRAWVSGALYSESDFESTDTPIYAFAVDVEHNDFFGTTTGVDLKSTVVGTDAIFKFKGFAGIGQYYWRTRKPEEGADFKSNGWYAQANYLLDRRRTWEVGFRYGDWDAGQIDNLGRSEIRGVVNYYYRRHNLKLQTDFGQNETQLGSEGGSLKGKELRTQLQFIF
jgi:phosphate-selective porin OprO/OprP